MMKKAFTCLFLFFLFANTILCLPAKSSSASDFTFSLIWITDTQYLSQNYPAEFDRACQWIVDNKDAYNIRMVVHTGDIVNIGTDMNQWANANHSLGILLGNAMPYCWDAGNHDQTSGSWAGKNFRAFNAALMESKLYWEADCLDGKNTATSFNVSNEVFMIVNIEYHANSTVIQWLTNILDAHADAHVVLATHAYLNESCGYGNDGWASRLRDNVLTNHSNVFMTLNGHYHSSSTTNHTTIGNRQELFFDFQDQDGQKGGATLRILTFDLTKPKVDIKTYKPFKDQFLTDSNNQFSLDLPFEAIPEFPSFVFLVPFALISFFSVVIVRRHTRRTKRVLRLARAIIIDCFDETVRLPNAR
jgi:hypothetical protein